MTSDQLVSARDVLRAITEVRRVGADHLLRAWERREPDLTEHLLEGLSELHRLVVTLAPHPKAERRLVRFAETLVLVQLTALRRALLRQWRGDDDDDNGGGDAPGDTGHPPTESNPNALGPEEHEDTTGGRGETGG
jgi:hypothetical protein